VGVVAAGVHRTGDLGREPESGVLVQRQRVHVAAQQHRRARPLALDDRNDRGQRVAALTFEADRGELLEDDRLCGRQVQPDLGMAVDPPPDVDDGRQDRLRGGEEIGLGGRFVRGRALGAGHALRIGLSAASSSARFGASHRSASATGIPLRAA
jgi:hypothetical protein